MNTKQQEIVILVDCDDILPEIKYIGQLFSSIFDAHFKVCGITEQLANKESIYIAYCSSVNDESFLSQQPLLQIIPDTDFWKRYLDGGKIKLQLNDSWELPIIGSHNIIPSILIEHNKHIVTADIFVAAFSFVTRFEEIDNPAPLDAHGRFLAKNSIANNFVEAPLVNLYAKKLRDWIEQVYGVFVSMRYRGLTVVMSHDIDFPFYFSRGRSEFSEFKNSLLGKNGKYKNWLDLWRYVKFFIGAESDPYDTFEYMCNVEKGYGVKSTYFILLSEENRWGLDLKRYSQRLNMLIEAGHEIALHPGYTALANESVIGQQRDTLEQLVGKKIHGVRHHFLRFQIPESYKAISNCGLDYDSSLGYAEKNGFRAGICTPFKPYDTKHRTTIDLWEIPLIIMDGTLKDYEGYSPEEALEKIKNIAIIIQDTGGVLVLNWHNSFFEQGGIAWRKVYEECLKFFADSTVRFCTCKQLVGNIYAS